MKIKKQACTKMGKQINFYLLEADVQQIQDYVLKNDFEILTSPTVQADLWVSNHFFAKSTANILLTQHYLVLKNHRNSIKNVQNTRFLYFNVNFLRAPLIEFASGGIDKNGNLRRGRFYLETGYWNENKEWIEKNPEFLQAAKKLFAWFKKNFHKIDDQVFYGNYTSQNVQKWVENGGKIVLN